MVERVPGPVAREAGWESILSLGWTEIFSNVLRALRHLSGVKPRAAEWPELCLATCSSLSRSAYLCVGRLQ